MPIAFFTKALSGDLTAVSKNKHYNPTKLKKSWEIIFNQHLQAHGLPQSYVDYMKLMLKVQKTYDQALNHGKKWLIIKAKVYEYEAKKMLSGESESIELTCAKISQFVGFPVKADVCSVSEFYAYIKLMSN